MRLTTAEKLRFILARRRPIYKRLRLRDCGVAKGCGRERTIKPVAKGGATSASFGHRGLVDARRRAFDRHRAGHLGVERGRSDAADDRVRIPGVAHGAERGERECGTDA